MKCICGCGRKLKGNQQKYCQPSHRFIHIERMLKNGCYPIDKVKITNCQICGDEYLEYIHDRRSTCHQFSGKPCNRALTGKKNAGKQAPVAPLGQIPIKKRRPTHIKELCCAPPGCKRYAEGFNINNLDSGCWGRKYYKKDGSCFVPEPITEALKYSCFYRRKQINKTGF